MAPSNPCDVVTERLALGEPLADVEPHVATCPACSRLVALPRLVAASAHAIEPRPGFPARTAAGARTRLATRRRNRIIGNGVAGIAAVVVGILVLRTPADPEGRFGQGAFRAPAPPTPMTDTTAGDVPGPGDLSDDELGAELARLTNLDRALAPSRAWDAAEAPLAPYRLIVRQGDLR